MVRHFLKWWANLLTTVDIWGGSILYLHPDTDTCMHICIWTADNTVKPVLSGHSKKKANYCLMQVKSIADSAILSTFIKLPFLFRSLFCLFEWLLKTCFTVVTTYMYFLFCGVY